VHKSLLGAYGHCCCQGNSWVDSHFDDDQLEMLKQIIGRHRVSHSRVIGTEKIVTGEDFAFDNIPVLDSSVRENLLDKFCLDEFSTLGFEEA
jgi:hypothetical protein